MNPEEEGPRADSDRTAQSNRRVLIGVVLAVAGMFGLSFAAVPLYGLFCRVTGYGGTTQVSARAPDVDRILPRTVTILFDAGTSRDMPWDFRPEQRSVTVHLGEQALVSYHAENRADRQITGTAIYNVTPLKAGVYFHKIECFCFGEQVLAAGQSVSMPVVFYVDPAMDSDPNMEDVDTITLSYTFFEADSPALEKALERFYNQ